MSGVCQVSRKSPVGIRMAFSAGFDFMFKSDFRFGIVDFLDVMGPMTVGAFGCPEVAQCIGFAVNGL